MLAPYTHRLRIETGDRQWKEHLEWLAGVMADLDRKAGVDILYDDAFIARRLDSVIENFEDRIRVAEELRATILRPLTPVAAPPPSPKAPGVAPRPAELKTPAPNPRERVVSRPRQSLRLDVGLTSVRSGAVQRRRDGPD